MVELAATIFVGFIALLAFGGLVFALIIWPYMRLKDWRADRQFRREQEQRHAERRAQRVEEEARRGH